MNYQHIFQSQYDLTKKEQYLKTNDSLLNSRLLLVANYNEGEYQLQNESLQIEWGIPQSLEPHLDAARSIEYESEVEGGFIVNFQSEYLSLSNQVDKGPNKQLMREESQHSSIAIKKKKSLQPCCKCKSSKCLKRYCPCFHNDSYCTNCSCKGCQNKKDNFLEVEEARMHVFKKCHRRKYQPREELLQNSIAYGCSCTKSSCQSGYCECFKRGQGCGENCKCQDCKNASSKISQDFPILEKSSTELLNIKEFNKQKSGITIENID